MGNYRQKNYLRIEILLCWLIVIFTISPNLFYAQNQRFTFHHLTPEDGLSQASNDYIYHDSKGFIWLSSIDGLNRFDGKTVKVYKSILGDSTSLLGNIITSNFFEDENSNLWFTTYEGIHCYLREQDNFYHFQIKNKKGEQLKQDYSSFHLDVQNQLWVRVGNGATAKLYLFDIEKKTARYLCPIEVQRNHVLLDKKGNVQQVVSFRRNNKSGMSIIEVQNPSKMQSFFDGKKDGLPSAYIYDIIEDGADKWYLGTDKGIVEFNPLKKNYEFFDKNNNTFTGAVRSILTVNDSIIWAATTRQGILIFNKKKKKFVNQILYEPQRKLGLQFKTAYNLFKDKNENVWISSPSAGVSFSNLEKQKFQNPSEFLDKFINTIFERANGEIFCSYNNDSIAYYPNTNATIQYSSIQFFGRKSKERIQYFFEDQDNVLWAVTSSFLLKWDKEKVQFEYFQNLPYNILYVFKMKKGRILFATYAGIYEMKKTEKKISIIPFQTLDVHQRELATAIFEDKKGRLFLGLDASRILILKQEGDKYSEFSQIEGIGYAKDFYEDEENIWVATSTGILKIDPKNLSSQLLNEKEEGAPNENYYCIIPDGEDSFWLSSNKGIIRYFPNQKRYRRYSLMDGLQANEYNTNAFLKTSHGEIWMGGTKGLNRFFPNKIQNLPYLPQIQITDLLVNDENYKLEKQIGELEKLDLEYYNNTISFNFVALEYSDPKNNQLQYQLENHDEGWVDANKNGFARYPNLPSGDYVFKIKATNSDGVWSENPRVVKIRIKTPWWRSWWFYLVCILGITAIIFGVSRYQLQQALKIERMRVKISSDLHDDVGGLLAGLTMQSELLELNAVPKDKTKLQRISELSRKAMSRMRDTVWAIDARKDKFENLLDRIREHALETLEMKDIHFDLKIDEVALDKNMSSKIRQNIYLICKEAITNAAKHSNGNQLKIIFEKHHRSQILLTIIDNGQVMKNENKSSGLGLSNMQLRAEQIGATMKISTENGFAIQVLIKKLN